MKRLLIGVLVACLCSIAQATVTTSAEQISIVKISATGSTTFTYYAKAQDGDWSASGCPNVQWVYFWSSESSAENMYSLILSAKLAGRSVRVTGNCTGTGYIYAEVIDLL